MSDENIFTDPRFILRGLGDVGMRVTSYITSAAYRVRRRYDIARVSGVSRITQKERPVASLVSYATMYGRNKNVQEQIKPKGAMAH